MVNVMILLQQGIEMLKRYNIVLMAFLLVLGACSNERQPITGMDGSAIPPAFANFPDMPFPNQAVKYLTFMFRKCLN